MEIRCLGRSIILDKKKKPTITEDLISGLDIGNQSSHTIPKEISVIRTHFTGEETKTTWFVDSSN